MLPRPQQSKARSIGVYLTDETIAKALAIVKSERVKSRNALFTSFLEFAVELFPLLRPMGREIEALQSEENCSYATAVARLVERGLRARGKGEK